jgi:hypothetical protein
LFITGLVPLAFANEYLEDELPAVTWVLIAIAYLVVLRLTVDRIARD